MPSDESQTSRPGRKWPGAEPLASRKRAVPSRVARPLSMTGKHTSAPRTGVCWRAMEPADLSDLPTRGRKSFEARLLSETIGSLSVSPALSVALDAPLKQAVELMQTEHIGCVLVIDAGGMLKGIFTERDLLNRVAGRGLDW